MKGPASPKWSIKFLRWFCPAHLYEEIEGDLIQKLEKDVKLFGERKAKRRLIWNVVRFFRPGIVLRNKFSIQLNQLNMLGNYFKLASRHLIRDKSFSFINVTGLSVGMVSFFMIVLYVDFESNYEQFHFNKNEIYRIALKRYENRELVNTSAKNYAGVHTLLMKNFPDVNSASRMMKIPANTGFLFGRNEKIYNEKGGMINVDTGFFQVFPSLLIRGDKKTVLQHPNSLVISESIAKKVFGDEDPMGKRIDALGENDGAFFTVTGILKDIPENSHFHANFVGRLQEAWPDIKDWQSTFIFNYLTLAKGASVPPIEARLNHLMQQVEKDFPLTKGTQLFLQPIGDIHLKSQLSDEYELNGNQTLVYALFAVALVILVIAWINYVNIAIARMLTRAREVGVRRIIGSRKIDIAIQFLIEYFCLNLIAVTCAILILITLVPQFENLTGIPIHRPETLTTPMILDAFLFFFIGSVVVGMYPALFLTKLNPAAALKGSFGGVNRGNGIRKTLMAVQFTSAIALIAFLLLINSQMNFMRTTNKKIEIEKVIALENPTAYSSQDEVKDKHDNFKLLEQKLLQNPAIEMVSTSSAVPGAEIGFTFVDLIKRKKNDPYDPTRYKTLFVGENFIPLYGLKLLAGRNFETINSSWQEPWERSDWRKIILNEKAIRILGFASPQEAVDQIVKYHLWGDDFEDYEIIGVIEDYHHEAIKKEVLPMILSVNYNSFQQVYYSVRLAKGSLPEDALVYIQQSWKEIFPYLPFSFFFLDDYYDQQFKSELLFQKIFGLFAAIAVFLACLGVFGISLFEVNTRLKEISIRKVLGATVTSLVVLLSRNNIRISILSALVATPTIYYAGHRWLSTYPTRIDFSIYFFLVPIIVLMVIVMITCSFQVIKGAKSNPVDHLKDE